MNVESTTDGVHFSNKVTLPDFSINPGTSAAIATFHGRLYLAWLGDFNELNIELSSDGVHFDKKAIFDETSATGPTLAVFNGRLYLGWTGWTGASTSCQAPMAPASTIGSH